MDLRKWHDVIEWIMLAFFLIAVVTAALNFTIAGFTPLIWFLISIWWLLIIICMETTTIRMDLDKKQ